MGQINEAVQALACAIGFWRPSWILLKELKNAKKKFTRQIPQGQYAYCKNLEIIRAGVFEWEQKQVAAAAGGLSKNNKSPPPHSGWRLDEPTRVTPVTESALNLVIASDKGKITTSGVIHCGPSDHF